MYKAGLCFALAELGRLHGWTVLSTADYWMTCHQGAHGSGKTKHSFFCPSPFKCICCNGAQLAGSLHTDVYIMLGFPQATGAMTPAKLKLSPTKGETSTTWAEPPPVYTEKLLPAVLGRYFMEVRTLSFWVFNRTNRLAPKPSTAD